MACLLSLLVVTCLICLSVEAWHSTVQFNATIDATSPHQPQFKLFQTAFKSEDFFALISADRNNHLERNATTITIGARDHLYQLSLPDLNIVNSLSWRSSNYDVMQCLNRSIIQNKNECANYIKLYLRPDAHTVRICSTNALNPKCRFYQTESNITDDKAHVPGGLIFLNETSGLGYSPLKAYENKYVYNLIGGREKGNSLFTGNSIDLNRYLTSVRRNADQEVGTNVDDRNWMDRAEFVDSFSDDQRAFFVFNEETTDPVKQKAARISQVCLNDPGAPLNSLRNIWTTYLKARLSCVYNAARPSTSGRGLNEDSFDFQGSSSKLFHFNEIKSMSELFTQQVPGTNTTNTYFYALFTTSKYAVTASAICKFSLDQVLAAFRADYSSPDGQPISDIPQPPPSSCPAKLTYQHLIFSRKHTMMATEVQSEAIVVETARKSRFTSIDADFTSPNSDLVFVGTDSGQVFTFVIQNNQILYSEHIQLGLNTPILSIKLNELANSRQLILMTQSALVSIPAAYCNSKPDQTTCNTHPYCKWSLTGVKCLDSNSENISTTTTTTTTTTTSTSNFSITFNYSSAPIRTYYTLDTTQDVQLNLSLFTFSLVIVGFVSGSFVLGAAVSAALLGVRREAFVERIKSFRAGRMNRSSPRVEEKEKEIDQFESLYSQVINPKKREQKGQIRQQQVEYAEPVGAYLANIDLPLNSQFFVNNSRFFEYDESEYFTIKNSRYRQNGARTNSTSSSSGSSESSGRTLNSRALLVQNQRTLLDKKGLFDQAVYSVAGGRTSQEGFYI